MSVEQAVAPGASLPASAQTENELSRRVRAEQLALLCRHWLRLPLPILVARLVAESGVQNLVFLSGDYHCAGIGAFDFAGARGYAIVAPPFYAPYPFANALERDLAESEALSDSNGEIGSCRAKAYGLEGFALIRARRARNAGSPEDWEIDVELYRGSEARTPARKALLAGGAADWS